jgi:hypothetical protein
MSERAVSDISCTGWNGWFAQTPVIRRRLGEQVKSTHSGRSACCIIQAARVRKTREGEPCGFHEAQFFLIDFDPLGERVEVIAAVAAAMVPMRLHAPEM